MALPFVVSIIDDATGQPVANYAVRPSKDGKSNIFEYDMGSDDTSLPISGDEGREAIGPHTITFSDGTSLPVAERQSRTIFRYPYMTSTVVATAADLIAKRVLPPYGDPGAKIRIGGDPLINYTPLVYDSPNAMPGLVRGEGGTGERPELQICTDWGAGFLMGAIGPHDVLAQGEALGTIPVHFVDKTTRKPIDKIKFPYADCFGDAPHYHAGNPWFRDTPHSGGAADNDPFVVDAEINHAPDPGFVACMITRDGFLLRQMQCWANYTVLSNGYVDTADNLTTIEPIEQRYLAWGINLMLSAYMATKEFEDHGELPDDCLPSSYFLTLLNKTIDLVLKPFKNDPNHQWCRTLWLPDATGLAPWQMNYLLSVLGRAVLYGLTQFNEYFLWGLQGTVDLLSGKTAWWPCKALPYYLPLTKPDGSFIKSWDELVAQYILPPEQGGQLGNLLSPKQLAELQADRFNGGWFPDDDLDGEYAMGAHGVFSLALYIHQLGIVDVVGVVPDLPVAYGNLQRMFFNWNLWPLNFFNARNAVVFDKDKIAAMGIDISPTPLPGVTDPAQTPNPIPDPVPPTPPQDNPPGTGVPPVMTSPLQSLNDVVATIKADAAAVLAAAAAEVSAVHARIVAILAAAAGGTVIDPAELQAQVDALTAAHTSLQAAAASLTADTVALPGASS